MTKTSTAADEDEKQSLVGGSQLSSAWQPPADNSRRSHRRSATDTGLWMGAAALATPPPRAQLHPFRPALADHGSPARSGHRRTPTDVDVLAPTAASPRAHAAALSASMHARAPRPELRYSHEDASSALPSLLPRGPALVQAASLAVASDSPRLPPALEELPSADMPNSPSADVEAHIHLSPQHGAAPGASRRWRLGAHKVSIDVDDTKVTWLTAAVDQICQAPAVVSFTKFCNKVIDSTPMAVLLDLMDVALYGFSMYTNVRMIRVFAAHGDTMWFALNLWFITWHYVIMALLLLLYVRRQTGRFAWWLTEEQASASRHSGWLLFIPAALPSIIGLDAIMLFTSLMPVLFPQSTSELSSFLSNYNFSRLFIKFVCESIPQTITQTYIISQLFHSNTATSHQLATVGVALLVSTLNVAKYSWKMWKGADSAGMLMWEFSKYLLLLKGNYECSPGAMQAQISDCCTLAGGVLSINGFSLHKAKAKFGPAQQAYILLNSYERFEGFHVSKLVVSGCPLPSINRILQRGLAAFPMLEALEVNECAFRGNNWDLVRRAIAKHPSLTRVKIVQTGALKRYKNFSKDAIAGIFKAELGLQQIAICVPWWRAETMERAARYLRDNTHLHSLAIEYPFRNASDSEMEALQVPDSAAHVGQTYCWALSSVLLSNTALQALYLHYHAFNEEGFGLLAMSLVKNSNIAILSLKGSSIGDQGAIELGKLLRINTVLTQLNLRSSGLHAEGLSAVCAVMVENRWLRILDLSNNRVHSSCVTDLARALRHNTSLEALKLEGWKDTFEAAPAVAALAGAVASNRGLRSLSMAETVFGSGSLAPLGAALSVNCTLTCLDLSSADGAAREQRIGDRGVADVAEALLRNHSLQELSLRGNLIGNAASFTLASALRRNTTLRSLDLGSTGLLDRHVTDIATAVGCNSSLTRLSLSKAAAVDVEGMCALSAAIRSPGCALRALDLSFIETPQEQEPATTLWSALANGLSAATALNSLNLSYSGLNETGLTALAAALLNNSSLQELDVLGCSEHQARQAFHEALGSNKTLRSLRATGEQFAVKQLVQRRTRTTDEAG